VADGPAKSEIGWKIINCKASSTCALSNDKAFLPFAFVLLAF
jgi:hypothetical protein